MLQACVANGVRRIVVSSSGAAYGYHADNPAWLTEDGALVMRRLEQDVAAWDAQLGTLAAGMRTPVGPVGPVGPPTMTVAVALRAWSPSVAVSVTS